MKAGMLTPHTSTRMLALAVLSCFVWQTGTQHPDKDGTGAAPLQGSVVGLSATEGRAGRSDHALQQSASTQGGAALRSNPEAWFAKGQAALQNGDLEEAEAAFRKVVALDPRSGAAYSNLGVIAMRRKNWDQAIALLRKAERLEPKMTGIRLNIGLAEYRRANYPAAIGPLSSVVKEQPGQEQARYLLGLCYSFLEKYREAAATLEPLWPKRSNDFVYLYVLSISAFHAGDKELDQRASEQLVKVGGDRPEFHLLMGKALLNHGEEGKALEELQKAEATNPNLPFLHFNLGLAHQRLGLTEVAEEDYRKDIALEPDMAYNYEQLGKIYELQGRDEDAEKMYRAALAREPRLTDSLWKLGEIHQKKGKNQEALKELDAALKLTPDNGSIHFVRGRVLLALGRKEEGKAELATAQKMLDSALEKKRAMNKEREVPNPELTQEPL
jgi:tetratricopeptide (TPR) repeat protein